MKESKFIELLNLYLDQQIEPAAAALLEEEIARNPARRITYEQYCRMHRACTLLFEQSRPSSNVGVKLATTAAAADEKMLAFPTPRRSYAWVGYAVGLAAAACVAFVFFYRPENVTFSSPTREEVVQIMPAKAPVAPKSGLVMSPVNYQPAVPNTHSVRRVANAIDEQPSLDWMRQVQFTPILQVSADELVFDQHSTTPNEEGVFHSRLPVQTTPSAPKMELMKTDAEKAAWQFQR